MKNKISALIFSGLLLFSLSPLLLGQPENGCGEGFVPRPISLMPTGPGAPPNYSLWRRCWRDSWHMLCPYRGPWSTVRETLKEELNSGGISKSPLDRKEV